MRKGRLHLAKTLELDAEAMKAMSDAELQDAIVAALSEDAYARQAEIASAEGAPVSFRGKHLALGMESTFFMCPDCGQIGTLTSDDEGARCTSDGCGFAAKYLPTGYLEGARFETLTEWDLWQHAELDARIAAAREAAGEGAEPVQLFADDVILDHYNEAHELLSSVPGHLTVFVGGESFATFAPKDGEPIIVTPADVEGMALFVRNTLIAHVGKPAQHFEVRGADDLRFNAVKYSYAFDTMRG